MALLGRFSAYASRVPRMAVQLDMARASVLQPAWLPGHTAPAAIGGTWLRLINMMQSCAGTATGRTCAIAACVRLRDCSLRCLTQLRNVSLL